MNESSGKSSGTTPVTTLHGTPTGTLNNTRWSWYLLVSLIAVTSAEGLSWSTPLIFPTGIFVLVIYGLHYLLIMDFLVRRRALTLRALAVGGVVIGFTTESLLTKVIWNPPWDEGETLRILGVGVFEVGFIVLVWHAWMSMALPVALTLRSFGLADILTPLQTRRILLALPLTMWIAAGLNGANPLLILLYSALNGFGILLAAWLFQHNARRQPFRDVTDMALTRRERRIVWGLTILVYAVFLPHRAEAFPAAGPFVLGMALVAGSIWLLGAVRRADTRQMPPVGPWRFQSRQFLRYLGYFLAASLVLSVVALVLNPVALPLTFVLMMLSIVPGDAYMLRLVWRLRPRRVQLQEVITHG
ncbi:MAG: hypothetical protein GYB65_22265 [Chloroflexi bacterium]|nr:hypothetical protein [Chloroflexota bacterium]